MPGQEMIDGGAAFDWGRASGDYARYRDLYPPQFYDRVLALGLCPAGGAVLDIGTGTGVLPRALHRFGAHFTGVDASPNQIAEARRLSEEAGLGGIEYVVAAAEEVDLPDEHFDAVTACQCFEYFEVARLAKNLRRMLKPGGLFGILQLEWLPHECDITRRSEELVRRHNPAWTGWGYTRKPPAAPAWMEEYGFGLAAAQAFDVKVPFAREAWHGRMRACRGVGASMDEARRTAWDEEHRAMLATHAPAQFTIPHHAVMLVLKKR